jgi:glycosyltransferase involved in cell wall biosynthesis
MCHKPTVSFHEFQLVPRSVGGAPLYYSEIVELLKTNRSNFNLVSHDLHSLLKNLNRGLAFLSRLERDAIVISTAGPYAHFYYYLRELLGQNFKIVRDVRTTSWAPYLLQEELCAPLSREQDLVVYPSAFAKAYFQKVFPKMSCRRLVAYPLAEKFPKKVSKIHSKNLRIGYLGRISKDKNFYQVLDVFSKLLDEDNVHLHIAGPIYPPTADLTSGRDIFSHLRVRQIPIESVSYWGDLAYKDIWNFLANVDVLFFPSLSSNESFGRVLLECARADVPVVTANYAAAPELIPAENIVRTHYTLFSAQHLSFPYSLGTVNISDSVSRLLSFKRPERDISLFPKFQSSFLLHFIENEQEALPADGCIAPVIGAFLNSMTFQGIETLDIVTSLQKIASLIPEFVWLHSNRFLPRMRAGWYSISSEFNDAWLKKVLRERLLKPHQRWALRNSIFYCEFMNFKPTLEIIPCSDIERLLLQN